MSKEQNDIYLTHPVQHDVINTEFKPFVSDDFCNRCGIAKAALTNGYTHLCKPCHKVWFTK